MGAIFAACALLAAAVLARDLLRQVLVRLVWAVTPPCALGDTLEIDGVGGEVTQLGWTHIRLLTENGDVVLVPNARAFRSALRRVSGVGSCPPVEVLLPLPAGVGLARAWRAAREAALVSPYVSPARPLRISAATGAGEHLSLCLCAGVVDRAHRDACCLSIVEGFAEALGGSPSAAPGAEAAGPVTPDRCG